MDTADKIRKAAGSSVVSWRLVAHLMALRPKQWIKNGLVFLPLLFAINEVWSLTNLAPIPELLLRLVFVFLAFCAVSSGVYLLNDLMDREADRLHPTKRYRPIASGKVTVPSAIALMLLLGVGGLAVMFLMDPVLGGVGLLYVFINVAYSMGIKTVVLVDIIMVASGYVIRAGAGPSPLELFPLPGCSWSPRRGRCSSSSAAVTPRCAWPAKKERGSVRCSVITPGPSSAS